MGIEYKIGCRNLMPEAVDSLLRRAPFFARREPKYQGYEYRAPGNQDTTRMPDAHANIHEGSIIFVDNGNRLLCILSLLVLQLMTGLLL
jgi:hypothetical protein